MIALTTLLDGYEEGEDAQPWPQRASAVGFIPNHVRAACVVAGDRRGACGSCA